LLSVEAQHIEPYTNIDPYPSLIATFFISLFSIAFKRFNLFVLHQYFHTELLYFSRWMNGQHLRSFPTDELIKAFEDRWKDTGILQESESGFAKVKKMLSVFFFLAPVHMGSLYIGSTY